MRALFLDRDGVINKDYGYVHTPDKFVFKDGIFELTSAASSLGYLIFVVTNQSGIARGYYSEKDFLTLTDWMHSKFLSASVEITRTYYCPHHPLFGSGMYRKNCQCRKPNPGLFFDAKRDFSVNMIDSIMIGDKESDLQAAEEAGVGTLILLDEHGSRIHECGKFYVYKDLSEIIDFIVT